MYKIKLINYKPYEYELLLKTLNDLGLQGYTTKDLSLITLFKKTDKKYHYCIDFYNPKGKTKNEKFNNKQIFFDPYLEDEYEAIYNKNGMYVFVGEKKRKKELDLSIHKDFITDNKTFKYLNLFIASIIVTISFLILSLMAINIDTFLSYGMTFVYGGIIIGLLTTVYRCFVNMYMTKQFQKKIHKQDNKLSTPLLTQLRKIYKVSFIIILLLFFGGLIEDTLNAKAFTPQDHSVISLNELGINEKTDFSGMVRSSFTVPHSYSSLEVTKEEKGLYVKEYQLRNEKSAKKLLNDFSKNPNQYYCSRVEKKENILYGYLDNILNTLILQKDKHVILVSLDEEITQKQVQIIINYYR